MTKRVAIAGSSGLIGGALRRELTERGGSVVRLVRRAPESPDEVEWDPRHGHIPDSALEAVEAVVNLAGTGIGDKRLTPERKREVERTRTDATGTLANALVSHRERTGRTIRLVNASAVGYYGDRGEEVLTETSPPGQDFLAGVVSRWEAAADPAREAGIPVATIRSGLVMAHEGGAFEPILRLARLGLGGPLGSGREWWPWITLVDEVRAILHLLDDVTLTGPVNLVAPQPARQVDIARAIGSALSRPAVLPAPRFAMRLVVGQLADSILSSQRVVPAALLASGFAFEHAELATAVTWLVRR